MAEPIELKIGQVWESLCRSKDTGARYRVALVSIGPDFVAVQVVSGAWPHFESVRVWRVDQLRGDHTLLRPKHELWVNVYRNQIGDTWAGSNMISRGKADEDSCRRGTQVDRIACLKIEFEEGDGL